MYRDSAIIGLLKRNDVNPKRGIDICCGDGSLVSILSSEYQNGDFYGLDLNRQALAKGIATGNFKKATPIHGNAYQLPMGDFTKASLDSESTDWMSLKHKKLDEPLNNYDLITAVNPACRLSINDINSIRGGGESSGKFIPLYILSSPAQKGGNLAYVEEIAHRFAGIYGGVTPRTLTEKQSQMKLEDLQKRGTSSGLDFVDYEVIGDRNSNSVDMAVLFKKR